MTLDRVVSGHLASLNLYSVHKRIMMLFLSVNIVQCVWYFCIYAYLVFYQRRNVSTYHYESARVQ